MTTDTSSDAAGEPPRRSGRSSRPPGPGRTSASSSTSSTEVGVVGRPHGLDGAFHVVRPEPEVFEVGVRVSVAGVNHSVIRVAGTSDRPVIRLRAVTSRDAALALRGEALLVERATLPLEADEYWADDLVGLAVVDGEREVGVVDRVRALPSCEVLEVTSAGDPNLRGSKDETLLIPLVSDAVRDVDLAAGRIDVDLGFLGGS